MGLLPVAQYLYSGLENLSNKAKTPIGRYGCPSNKFLIDWSYKQLHVEVQEKVHELKGCTPGLEAVYVPGFVRCISCAKDWPMFNLFRWHDVQTSPQVKHVKKFQ